MWINFQVKSCLIPVLRLLRSSPGLQKASLCIPSAIFNKATEGSMDHSSFITHHFKPQASSHRNLKSMARQKEIHGFSYSMYISIGDPPPPPNPKEIETGWAKRNRDDDTQSNALSKGWHALVKSSTGSHRPVPLLKADTWFVLLRATLKSSFVPVEIFPLSLVHSCLGCTQTFTR